MTTNDALGYETAGLLFDEQGKERLYKTCRDVVAKAVAWKLAGFSEEEIEDVASSLWMKLLANDCAKLKTFSGKNGAQFTTWLVQVAKNAATDYLRKKRILTVPLDGFCAAGDAECGPVDFFEDGAPGPLGLLMTREARMNVLMAMKSLPKIYRRVVYARFYRGWSTAEIAATYGIAEDTVYVQLGRAFAKLRKRLALR